ncbi:MAG: helix-turn-helix transcriptional regulator [Desulfobacterales bacterium]|nr:helix-turn-helix transcriptional regulator [Desulfobacterales bacterium]
MGKSMKEMKKKLMKNAKFQKEYDILEEEFAVVHALIEARTRARLTQQEVAERMGTTQSAIARMESGSGFPSMTSIKKYAEATNSKIKINLIAA